MARACVDRIACLLLTTCGGGGEISFPTGTLSVRNDSACTITCVRFVDVGSGERFRDCPVDDPIAPGYDWPPGTWDLTLEDEQGCILEFPGVLVAVGQTTPILLAP